MESVPNRWVGSRLCFGLAKYYTNIFMKHKTIYALTLILLWVLIVLVTITSIAPFVPLKWVIHYESTEYSDVCVGERQQVVTAKRNVPFSLSASATSEVHQITGGIRLETTIKRKTDFVYQKANGEINYTILWDSPFMVVGEYEALQFIDIHFGWFNISGEAPRGVFSVIECQ